MSDYSKPTIESAINSENERIMPGVMIAIAVAGVALYAAAATIAQSVLVWNDTMVVTNKK